MRSLQRALAIVLLVLCGMLAGFLAYRSTHRPTLLALNGRSENAAAEGSTAATAATAAGARGEGAGANASGEPLDNGTQGESRDAARVPETVPDVRVPDLAGTQKSLRDYLGHPLIINFWATWCPPCRREMPLLQQLWTHYRPDRLQIVGVAVDSRSAVQQYLRRTPVDYPLLVGEEPGAAAVARFGVEPVLPFSVFADPQGRIVAVKIGELHRAEADYIISAIHQITQGRETLPQARAAIAAELRELAVQRAKAGAGAS